MQAHGQVFKVDTLFHQQDYAAAIQLLKKRIASNPDDEESLLKLANAYELNHQPDKEVGAFEQAAKLNPNSGRIQAQLGHAYLTNGQIEKAIPTLEEAVKTNPGNADALLYLGYAYQENHQRDRAIAAFEQALQADQNLDEASEALKALGYRSPETEKPKHEN